MRLTTLKDWSNPDCLYYEVATPDPQGDGAVEVDLSTFAGFRGEADYRSLEREARRRHWMVVALTLLWGFGGLSSFLSRWP